MNSFNKEMMMFSPRIGSREYILDESQNLELNTYATWGDMTPMYDWNDNLGRKWDNDQKKYVPSDETRIDQNDYTKAAGVRSIFNKYHVVFQSDDIRMGDNVPLIDTPGMRKDIKNNSNCSVKNLVQQSQSGALGAETYDYSDFAYCKHLGKISNNYMITLRRFPVPINDYINTPGYNENLTKGKNGFSKKGDFIFPASLGCMVTWLGAPGNDIENILRYDYSMPFKQMKSELQENKLDDSQSPLNALFSAFDPNYQKQVRDGYAGAAISTFGGPFKNCANAPYKDLVSQRDATKVYGPVDTINDTYIRSDEGLQFNHSFSLTFEYELRSYSNINTRQAMLDLLSNILAVTYTAGDFWGGGIRTTGTARSDLYTNLKIFKKWDNPHEFADAAREDAMTIFGKYNDKGVWELSDGGKGLKGYIDSFKSALKAIGQGFAGMIIGGALNKLGRPQKNFLNSLLSPAPVGLWHVTIGNPFHPIMSFGNMILEKTTITHTGALGLDDFPTGLKVVVDLKRAKGRDKRDIEKMYLHGINRIYTPVGSERIDDLIKAAPQYKSTAIAMDLNQVSQLVSGHDALTKKLLAAKSKTRVLQNPSGTESALIQASNNTDLTRKIFGTASMGAIMLTSEEIAYGSVSKKKSETVKP
jgi:hypothetical protein